MLYSTLLPFLLPAANAQLNTLAKAAGLKYFGTATDNPELTDTAYLEVLSNISEFGQITIGNSQKWDTIEPSDGTFSFTEGDAMVALAKNNTQILRFSSGTWTSETLTAVLTTHITTEVTHYKGQCYAWDVVNEALNDDTDATFRANVFYNTIGEDYIRIAFETAAAADPDAKLYYNDYSIESAGAKATAALNIVKSLKASGTKIDGVGFESHFIVGSTPSTAAIMSSMEAFIALGVEVAITELDIRMTLPSTTAQLAQQSIDYQNAVSACIAVADCVGVTVWDFDDKVSWVPETFPGEGAACLFDEDLNRKPAFYGVVSALSSTT